jgi:O-antigen/teichoic acid export membrane protein
MSQQRANWTYQDSSLQRSFLWSLAITLLPVASGFIVSWVIARWSGPRILGTVSWVMSFATAALILGKFGLDLAASRLASEYGVRDPGHLRRLFRTAVGMRSVFTLLVALPSFLLARPLAVFFHDVALTAPIRIGALIMIGASIYEFFENFLIGLNRLQTVYKVRSTHLVLRIVIVCLLVYLARGATMLLGGYVLAWLVAISICAFLLWRHLPAAAPGRAEPGLTRRLLMLSLTLAVSSASVTVYSHMDRLMLGYFSGVEEVGQYAVARNITEVTLFPVFAMAMMLRPALASRFGSTDLGDSARIIRHSLRFSLVSGVLFAAIFVVLGVPLVVFVFSTRYRYAGDLMLFFTTLIALRSIGSVVLPALIAADRTRVYAYLTTTSAVVNFFLNLVLIPRFQSRGAILATIVSYAVLLVIGLKEVFATYHVRVDAAAVSLSVRTVLAGTLAALVTWSFTRHGVPGWMSLIWAAVLTLIYLSLVVVLRVGSVGELRGIVSNSRVSKG